MYVDIMEGNTYYRLYFCLFYYSAVIIGINIVVAFAIDMYSSVERLDKERQNTLEMLENELSNGTKGESDSKDDFSVNRSKRE